MQLDFGEEQQRKSVTLVEAAAGRPARIEQIALTAGRTLRTVEGSLDELKEQALNVGDDYLRVYVKLEQPMNELADQVREFLPNAVQIRPRFPDSIDTASKSTMPKASSPEEQFSRWFQEYHAVAAPEPVLNMFRSLYEEALHAAD